jgi:hypothetical protein
MNPIYEIQASVTSATQEEGIKLTADWPLVWLQAPDSTTILRRLSPNESLPALAEPVQRLELGGYNRPELRLGDRVIVQLF